MIQEEEKAQALRGIRDKTNRRYQGTRIKREPVRRAEKNAANRFGGER